MKHSFPGYCLNQLKEVEAAGLLRRLQSWEQRDSRTIWFQKRELINFSSNDYLGLATHPRVRKELGSLWDGKMIGAAASRLITGNHTAYQMLETEIANFKRSKAALVFTNGYTAALGTIPALVGKKDFIVMDKLCHACLIDGARLSGATIRIFPHNHLKHCEKLLANIRLRAGNKVSILLITESIFSMDGDFAPLDELVRLKKQYDAWLMVDEAHATGVLGENGRGGSEYFGVENEVEVSMGTLSKAFGCVGGFICGSQKLKELLVNRARSLIYSTGLPAAICKASMVAIRIAREEPFLREKLWKNVKSLEEKLGMKFRSPIIPIMMGDERYCTKIAEELREKKFMIPAVRYPTVARGKARLRVSISAAHTEEDIACLAQSLQILLR